MTTTTSITGKPCWIELFTADPAAADTFYGELLGWTANHMGEEYGGYTIFSSADGAPVAGCMRNDGAQGAPDGWSVYLATPSVEETVRRASEAGGQVVAGPMQVGEMGHMAFLVDSAGAAVGVWQPTSFDGGQSIRPGVLGTPAWYETLSRDYTRSVDFYTRVFDWDAHTMSDTDEFRYTTHGGDDDAVAGIMDGTTSLPDGVDSFWQIYLQVEDADAALARAAELGGRTVQEPRDTPWGRIATIADPTDATFNVMSPNG